MSHVLSEEKKQQVIALGKLGWSLRRIQQATGVRRETASAYLKAAGVEVYRPRWGRRAPTKPAISDNVGAVKSFFPFAGSFLFSFLPSASFPGENTALGSSRSPRSTNSSTTVQPCLVENSR